MNMDNDKTDCDINIAIQLQPYTKRKGIHYGMMREI